LITDLKNFDASVCSNAGVDESKTCAEISYRKKSKGMDKVRQYELLHPDASKKEFYRQSASGYAVTYVVDGSLRNIKAAYEVDMEFKKDYAVNSEIERIFISNNKKERKIAHERYGARRFSNLLGFYNLAIVKNNLM
jgi:hypothetical protein